MLNKILYNTVLCQTFTPCGKYLVAGNIYGQIAVFDLDRIINPAIELLSTDYNKPKCIHTIDTKNQICSLASVENYLIIGTVNKILGFEWNCITGSKLGKAAWSVQIPVHSSMEVADVNSLWLTEDKEKLLAGCGDNKVYVIHLEDGKIISKLEGHSSFVYCVHGKDQQLVSSGEDGCVLFWDMRSCKSHSKLEPHKISKVNRPDIGKWIGSVALKDDWIVCGGGPKLALYHRHSLDAVTVFDIPDNGIHVSFFHDDCIVAGGTAKHFYQLAYNGDVRVELPVSASTVYSAELRISPNNVLAIAGSSPEIDLCTSFNYRDQVLHFR